MKNLIELVEIGHFSQAYNRAKELMIFRQEDSDYFKLLEGLAMNYGNVNSLEELRFYSLKDRCVLPTINIISDKLRSYLKKNPKRKAKCC